MARRRPTSRWIRAFIERVYLTLNCRLDRDRDPLTEDCAPPRGLTNTRFPAVRAQVAARVGPRGRIDASPEKELPMPTTDALSQRVLQFDGALLLLSGGLAMILETVGHFFGGRAVRRDRGSPYTLSVGADLAGAVRWA
jgi:hypothetical protein